MNRREGFYMFIAFMGFCLMVFLVIKNTNWGFNTRVYSPAEVYEPGDYKTEQMAARDIWESMSGQRSITCNIMTTIQSKRGILYVNGTHKNLVKCFFLNSYDLYGDLSLGNQSHTGSNWDDVDSPYYAGIHNFIKVKGSGVIDESTALIIDLVEDSLNFEECFEILAPFDYTFVNTNVGSQNDDGTETIVILSIDGNVRITFDKVQNWFCAGSYANNVDVDFEEWKKHGKSSTEGSSHYTIIGNSNSSKCTGGLAGDVIGYANRDKTTISVEIKEGSSFVPAAISYLYGKGQE